MRNVTDAELEALGTFLRGLAEGRGGDLSDAARYTCAQWAKQLQPVEVAQ